jgi:hypothetical protein
MATQYLFYYKWIGDLFGYFAAVFVRFIAAPTFSRPSSPQTGEVSREVSPSTSERSYWPLYPLTLINSLVVSCTCVLAVRETQVVKFLMDFHASDEDSAVYWAVFALSVASTATGALIDSVLTWTPSDKSTISLVRRHRLIGFLGLYFGLAVAASRYALGDFPPVIVHVSHVHTKGVIEEVSEDPAHALPSIVPYVSSASLLSDLEFTSWREDSSRRSAEPRIPELHDRLFRTHASRQAMTIAPDGLVR